MGLPNKCKKVNRSSSSLVTWLVPQFVKDMFSAEDPIHDIVIDNSRNILYSLSKRNRICVFDLGDDGETFLFIYQQDVATMVCFFFFRCQGPHASQNFDFQIQCINIIFPSFRSVYEAYSIAFGRSKPKRIL